MLTPRQTLSDQRLRTSSVHPVVEIGWGSHPWSEEYGAQVVLVNHDLRSTSPIVVSMSPHNTIIVDKLEAAPQDRLRPPLTAVGGQGRAEELREPRVVQ